MKRYLLYVLIIMGMVACFSDCSSTGKRILVIHSYEDSYPVYPEYNRLIAENFNKGGVQAEIETFYLDCENYGETQEINRMYHFLDSIAAWEPDLILVNDDQATYSTLKSYHPLLRRVPIVFTGVNYPNKDLLKDYSNVTGFQDKIDLKTNVRIIRQLTGMLVCYTVVDYTFLDRRVRADIVEQLADEVVLNLDFHLDKKGIAKEAQKGNQVFTAYSIRRLDKNWPDSPDKPSIGTNIFWSLSKFNNSAYLQTKFDFTTAAIASMNSTNRFSAINEMFGCGYSFLAGYVTPLETQVKDAVKVAVRILNGEDPAQIPVQVSEKEYLIDWKVMRKEGVSVQDVPPGFRIINMPFEARYPVLWALIIWGSMLVLSVLFGFIVFLYKREASKKRQAVHQLAEERKFLILAIEGSHTYAWKLENGILIFENAFWKDLHLSPRPLPLEEFASYIHPDYKDICKRLAEGIMEQEKNRAEIRSDFNDQGFKWWELRYSIIEEVPGQKKIAGLLLDIESYKKREQELIEARELAEQAELKQSFLANMSHEIRTPLNAIVGFSNLLASEEESLEPQERKQYVELINSNSELLLKLINDILEISRIESGYMSFEYASYSLKPILDEVYNTHRMLIPEHLRFEYKTDDVALQLYIDKSRLIQVLTNFLNNACKFTREGYIELGYRYLADQKQVEIYVEDSGVGIPPIEQKMIFNRFYKQNEFAQGTGLGLSICRVIIEKLHGDIGLTSEPGKGSRFSVFLDCELRNTDISCNVEPQG